MRERYRIPALVLPVKALRPLTSWQKATTMAKARTRYRLCNPETVERGMMVSEQRELP